MTPSRPESATEKHPRTPEEAAEFNARLMSTEHLRHEIALVSRFPEQPPVRVRYLEILREELSRRD